MQKGVRTQLTQGWAFCGLHLEKESSMMNIRCPTLPGVQLSDLTVLSGCTYGSELAFLYFIFIPVPLTGSVMLGSDDSAVVQQSRVLLSVHHECCVHHLPVFYNTPLPPVGTTGSPELSLCHGFVSSSLCLFLLTFKSHIA